MMYIDRIHRFQGAFRILIQKFERREPESGIEELHVRKHGQGDGYVPQAVVVRTSLFSEFCQRLVRRFADAEPHHRSAFAEPGDQADTAVQFPAEIEKHAAAPAHRNRFTLVQPDLICQAPLEQLCPLRISFRQNDPYGRDVLTHPIVLPSLFHFFFLPNAADTGIRPPRPFLIIHRFETSFILIL